MQINYQERLDNLLEQSGADTVAMAPGEKHGLFLRLAFSSIGTPDRGAV